MPRNILLGAGFTVFALAVPVLAQDENFERIANQCIEIVEQSKQADNKLAARANAQPFADQLERIAQEANEAGILAQLTPTLNKSAAECVSFARQISVGAFFDADVNRYVSAGQLAREKQRQRQEQAEQERLRREQEERLRTLEINRRVFQACSDLANSQPTEAYTNALCVQSFKANGLPE